MFCPGGFVFFSSELPPMPESYHMHRYWDYLDKSIIKCKDYADFFTKEIIFVWNI